MPAHYISEAMAIEAAKSFRGPQIKDRFVVHGKEGWGILLAWSNGALEAVTHNHINRL